MHQRLLLLAFAFLLAAAAAPAQEEKLKEIRGAIRQLDLKAGAVTLQLPYGDKQISLNFAGKEVPVATPLAEKLALADLREDLRIAVKVRGEDEIVAVKVDGPYWHGLVKKVDAANRAVTIKDVFGERTLQIPPGVKLVAKDAEIGLETLKAGDPLQVLYSLDKKRILQVHTGKGVNSRDPYLRITRYYGVIGELDHAKRQVQMIVLNTDAGIVRSYEISPDAYLRLQYHLKPIGEVGLDQFSKWVKAYYFVDRDTGRIINMDADLPVMLRRKVQKLEGNQITIEDEHKEKTLPLDARVKVLTPRGEGKLADVAVGRLINCGLSLDRGRVLVVYLWDK